MIFDHSAAFSILSTATRSDGLAQLPPILRAREHRTSRPPRPRYSRAKWMALRHPTLWLCMCAAFVAQGFGVFAVCASNFVT